MTKAEKTASKAKLRDFDEKDRARAATGAAKNALEAYIYSTQDRLGEEKVILHSTEQEREHCSQSLSAISDWLYSEGEDTTLSEYQEKKKRIRRCSRKNIFPSERVRGQTYSRGILSYFYKRYPHNYGEHYTTTRSN